MSEEKKLDENPTSVPRGHGRRRHEHSPLMQAVIKRRCEADRTDALIVAEAERVWADIVWPEEGYIYVGPPEEKEAELTALREDIARRKAALENINERSSNDEEKENPEDE